MSERDAEWDRRRRPAAEAAMWALAERHVGRVGYRRGVKAEGLAGQPPQIDCSGWVAALLGAGMAAENEAAGCHVFGAEALPMVAPWSDGMIAQIARRTDGLLVGPEIETDHLPLYATIGLNMGVFGWEANRRRQRGINHIVQVIRRPGDGEPFVSEAIGLPDRSGLFLIPLAEWLAGATAFLREGQAWAGDPFGSVASGQSPQHS